MTSQPEHPRCSLALHKKVLQYSPSIEQGRSRILPVYPYIPFFIIRTKSVVQGSLHSPFQNSDQTGRSWILAFPFKHSDRFDRGSLHSPFQDSDQIGSPWIPAFPF